MADLVFNCSKGRAVEKVADSATAVGCLILKTAASDATLRDFDTVAAILAGGSVEADFTNYVRKTGLTGTITVDDDSDWVTIDLPDQVWTSAGGATNNTTAKLIIYYQESASDAGRIPLVALDFVATTDSSNLTAQFHDDGFLKSA